jgi:hypothetical protein
LCRNSSAIEKRRLIEGRTHNNPITQERKPFKRGKAEKRKRRAANDQMWQKCQGKKEQLKKGICEKRATLLCKNCQYILPMSLKSDVFYCTIVLKENGQIPSSQTLQRGWPENIPIHP